MGSGRWRTAVAILGGSGWGWMVILPEIREVTVNPAIHPGHLMPLLLAACLVLFLVDVWAIWYWMDGKDDQRDQSHHEWVVGDRSADGDAGRR